MLYVFIDDQIFIAHSKFQNNHGWLNIQSHGSNLSCTTFSSPYALISENLIPLDYFSNNSILFLEMKL